MAIALFRRKLEGLLRGADILIDGDRPWDIHVQNPKLYARIWERGTLGAGEAYMEGWWDCDQLDEMIARTLRARMHKQLKPVFSLPTVVRARVSNLHSVGMFEHVGVKNYRHYFDVVRRCLISDGLFVLHTIGGNESVVTIDPWIAKYIFPNSMLPSASQIAEAAEEVLVMEDWHSFGADYDRTLMAWYHNFTSVWDEIKDGYDERFRRMWSYYLLSSAGAFRARENQLWQIVYSRDGLPKGYRAEAIR